MCLELLSRERKACEPHCDLDFRDHMSAWLWHEGERETRSCDSDILSRTQRTFWTRFCSQQQGASRCIWRHRRCLWRVCCRQPTGPTLKHENNPAALPVLQHLHADWIFLQYRHTLHTCCWTESTCQTGFRVSGHMTPQAKWKRHCCLFCLHLYLALLPPCGQKVQRSTSVSHPQTLHHQCNKISIRVFFLYLVEKISMFIFFI